MRPSARRVAIAAACLTLALAGVAPSAAAPAPGPLPTCTEPTSPRDAARTSGPAPTLPPVDADLVSTAIVQGGDFDTDGDGMPDGAALTEDGTVVIVRADGDVVLTGVFGLELAGVGDLDGDGGDEVVVAAADGDFVRSYLLPSSTAPGFHDVSQVAISAGPGYLEEVPDGSGRLVRIGLEPGGVSLDRAGVTEVIATDTVLAIGPGGDASGVAVLASAPGFPVAVAELHGPDGPGAILVGRAHADAVEVRVVDGDQTLLLTTRPEPLRHDAEDQLGVVEAQSGPDGRFVTLARDDGTMRSAFRWALDGRCGPRVDPLLPPITTPPSAPPAEAVVADANLTG